MTLETMPSVLFDALVVPGGAGAAQALGALGHALEFVKDQYRHCKPILAIGAGSALLENAGVPATLDRAIRIPGLLVYEEGQAEEALAAVHRARSPGTGTSRARSIRRRSDLALRAWPRPEAHRAA